MDLVIIFLGSACLLWTARELLSLGAGRVSVQPLAAFGAVDLDSGKPLEVVFDRRSNRRTRTRSTRPVHFRA